MRADDIVSVLEVNGVSMGERVLQKGKVIGAVQARYVQLPTRGSSSSMVQRVSEKNAARGA